MAVDPLPKVSVIIPVYNGTNYLHEAVDSVLLQTFPHVEILVVDDGSTDETWKIIQGYGQKVRGIHKENGGVASALNCGIQQASGEYIAWLSHDDLFLPNKLESQINYLRKFPQFAACYTDYYVIDTQGKTIAEVETPWHPREKALRELFGRMYISGSTMLIARHCFNQVGLFSEKWRYTQDGEMWLRLLRYYEIGRVPEKLGKERTHPSQGSRNLSIHRAEAQDLFEYMVEELCVEGLFPDLAQDKDNPVVKAKVYRWLGDTLAYHRSWYAFANKQYTRSLSLDPSWRNPARFRILVNQLRPCYFAFRRAAASVLHLQASKI